MEYRKSTNSSAVTDETTNATATALAGRLFDQYCNANTMQGIMGTFQQMCNALDLKEDDHVNFYRKIRSRLKTWKAQSLWAKLDKRASHKEYKNGTACRNTRVLVIGAGPCGLRMAVEVALLGGKAVVVEKRDRFSRNNVLHLWPFLIHDLKALGAKKFFGKFCAGAIDHISIRTLQCILLKVALLVGVEVHTGVSFDAVRPPDDGNCAEKNGWRAWLSPKDHPVNEYEYDVLIGADGKRNTLPGFKRKEFRGKLAIAITANFINRNTQAEASVEEISGVAFIFNQKFFKDLYAKTGIDLENIVYYKDETHYFVMTAKKHSLLRKGVLIQDFSETELLLGRDNINQEMLLEYAKEAADFSTNQQLPTLDFAHNHAGQADIAMFDFTSLFAAEYSSRIVDKAGHKLLMCLVGDSLLEPFWPTGSGCARGFLGALDTAWMIRNLSSGLFTPLEVLAERESVYQLLSQCTPENMNKNCLQYSIDPNSRYPNLNSKFFKPYQMRILYEGDDNASIEQILQESNKLYDKLIVKEPAKPKSSSPQIPVVRVGTKLSNKSRQRRQHHAPTKFYGINASSSSEDEDKEERETKKEKLKLQLLREHGIHLGDAKRKIKDITMLQKDITTLQSSEVSSDMKYSDMDAKIQKATLHLEKGNTGNLDTGIRGQNKVSELAKELGDRFEGLHKPRPLSAHKLDPKPLIMGHTTTTDRCYFCQKKVYLMERQHAEGVFFHRWCLKCDFCGTGLRLGSYCFLRTDGGEPKFFCFQHYGLRRKKTGKLGKRPFGDRIVDVEEEKWKIQSESKISELDEKLLYQADELPQVKIKAPRRKSSHAANADVIDNVPTHSSDVDLNMTTVDLNMTPERVEFENVFDGAEESEFEQTAHNLSSSCISLNNSDDEDTDSDSDENDSEEMLFEDDDPDLGFAAYESSCKLAEHLHGRKYESMSDDADGESETETETAGESSNEWESETEKESDDIDSPTDEQAATMKTDKLKLLPEMNTKPKEAKPSPTSLLLLKNKMSFFSEAPQVVRIDANRLFGTKEEPQQQNENKLEENEEQLESGVVSDTSSTSNVSVKNTEIEMSEEEKMNDILNIFISDEKISGDEDSRDILTLSDEVNSQEEDDGHQLDKDNFAGNFEKDQQDGVKESMRSETFLETEAFPASTDSRETLDDIKVDFHSLPESDTGLVAESQLNPILYESASISIDDSFTEETDNLRTEIKEVNMSENLKSTSHAVKTCVSASMVDFPVTSLKLCLKKSTSLQDIPVTLKSCIRKSSSVGHIPVTLKQFIKKSTSLVDIPWTFQPHTKKSTSPLDIQLTLHHCMKKSTSLVDIPIVFKTQNKVSLLELHGLDQNEKEILQKEQQTSLEFEINEKMYSQVSECQGPIDISDSQILNLDKSTYLTTSKSIVSNNNMIPKMDVNVISNKPPLAESDDFNVEEDMPLNDSTETLEIVCGNNEQISNNEDMIESKQDEDNIMSENISDVLNDKISSESGLLATKNEMSHHDNVEKDDPMRQDDEEQLNSLTRSLMRVKNSSIETNMSCHSEDNASILATVMAPKSGMDLEADKSLETILNIDSTDDPETLNEVVENSLDGELNKVISSPLVEGNCSVAEVSPENFSYDPYIDKHASLNDYEDLEINLDSSLSESTVRTPGVVCDTCSVKSAPACTIVNTNALPFDTVSLKQPLQKETDNKIQITSSVSSLQSPVCRKIDDAKKRFYFEAPRPVRIDPFTSFSKGVKSDVLTSERSRIKLNGNMTAKSHFSEEEGAKLFENSSTEMINTSNKMKCGTTHNNPILNGSSSEKSGKTAASVPSVEGSNIISMTAVSVRQKGKDMKERGEEKSKRRSFLGIFLPSKDKPEKKDKEKHSNISLDKSDIIQNLDETTSNKQMTTKSLKKQKYIGKKKGQEPKALDHRLPKLVFLDVASRHKPSPLEHFFNSSKMKGMTSAVPHHDDQTRPKKEDTKVAAELVEAPKATMEECVITDVDSEFDDTASICSIHSQLSISNVPMSDKYKKKIQKAAVRQQRQAEQKRMRMAQEVQRKLEEVEINMRDVEGKGVSVEKELYKATSNGNEEDTDLMEQWFNIIYEKNALVRCQSELLVQARELELEDRQARLQQSLRDLMSNDDEAVNPDLRDQERSILSELLEVVEQRDALVTMLEEERLRSKEEDRDLKDMMVHQGFAVPSSSCKL